MSKINTSLRYSAEHEWIDDRTPATVGVSQVAADALGDVVYVELPAVGASLTAGEVCGEIESTKSVGELYAPLTGEVVEINDAVVDQPDLVNADPFGQGWLIKVRFDGDLGAVMDAEAYAAFTGA